MAVPPQKFAERSRAPSVGSFRAGARYLGRSYLVLPYRRENDYIRKRSYTCSGGSKSIGYTRPPKRRAGLGGVNARDIIPALVPVPIPVLAPIPIRALICPSLPISTLPRSPVPFVSHDKNFERTRGRHAAVPVDGGRHHPKP